MNPSDLAKYKALYLEIAPANFDLFNETLTKLAQAPSDSELIDKAFRLSHMLKSESLAMQYEQMGFFCRVLESFFYKVKKGQAELTKDTVNSIQELIIPFEKSLENIKTNNAEQIAPEDITRLELLTDTKITD